MNIASECRFCRNQWVEWAEINKTTYSAKFGSVYFKLSRPSSSPRIYQLTTSLTSAKWKLGITPTYFSVLRGSSYVEFRCIFTCSGALSQREQLKCIQRKCKYLKCIQSTSGLWNDWVYRLKSSQTTVSQTTTQYDAVRQTKNPVPHDQNYEYNMVRLFTFGKKSSRLEKIL